MVAEAEAFDAADGQENGYEVSFRLSAHPSQCITESQDNSGRLIKVQWCIRPPMLY